MRTAAIFSDRMVLQREKPITVWGDGKDGDRVFVEFCGNSVSDTVRGGKWRVTLPPCPAADGLTMTVSCGAVMRVFREIAVGEVWLCGGQSNMEFEIKDEQHGAETLASLSRDCGVRFYYTPKQRAMGADFDAVERNTGWSYADPEGSKAWSAVGLYFALETAKTLGVTVGLIGCNWGGTSASVWVSRETLQRDTCLRSYLDDYDRAMDGRTEEQANAEFDEYLAYQEQWWTNYSALLEKQPDIAWDDALQIVGESRWPGPMGPKNETRPCGLYETMLRRVCPYTLRGFLYYQGESDDHKPDTYAVLLEALIGCWREDWGEADLPFLFVQLPGFRNHGEPDYQHWCRIREAQAAVYHKLRNTGLAVALDCGEWDNIHPKDKMQVAHRLALQALSGVYHAIPAQDADAPMFRTGFAHGAEFVVLLDGADAGFRLTGEPAGFELAGADGIYHPAKAVLMPGQIVLRSAEVSAPCNARYAWTNCPDVTVYGMNGLPLAPFRTDRF
ncbi:MAG: sialate O-acetylesterase [Oscillospiraceae bacterium]|nr:sialate O-acetylesterase [Oscillospiraceae bacterium]